MRICAAIAGLGLILLSTLASNAQTGNAQALNLYDHQITFIRPADSSQVQSKAVYKRGKEPVVLAFWLTTCQPCMREMDAYVREYASWQKQAKFRMIAVSIDYPNRFKRIDQIIKEKKLPFDALWDNKRRFKEILPGGLNGVPQVFLFNPDGKLVWQHKGYVPGDEAELLKQIKAHQVK